MKKLTTETSPPYGTTIRLAKAYEDARRQAVSPAYKAFRDGQDPLESGNWKHFERAAAMMIAAGCRDEEEWIKAQFLGASITDYPYPNNLYSERAVQRYIELCDTVGAPDDIRVQEQWLKRYRYKFPDLSVTEIVLDPGWAFQSWFRVYHAESVTMPQALAASEDLRRSTALRNAIVAAGYDLAGLEEKIHKVLQGE